MPVPLSPRLALLLELTNINKIARMANLPYTSVSRYMKGITRIPKTRLQTLNNAYRKAVYNQLRFYGIKPSAASVLRDQSVDTIRGAIETYQSLAQRIAHAYAREGVTEEDMIQNIYEGLRATEDDIDAIDERY